MSTTTLSQILHSVAEGTLSPEDATAAISALEPSALERSAPAPHGAPTDVAESPAEPVRRLIVKAGALRLVVIGDPTVALAVADGQHRAERDGDALVLNSNLSEPGYSTEPPRSAFVSWLSQVMDHVRATLTVRVNPDLPLQILMVGGTLDLTGVKAGASIGVEAGSARISDGEGPLHLEVTSGSARVDWTFTGASTVRADMGSAAVLVREGSDVIVTTEASLGQALVKAHDGISKPQGDQPSPPVSVGAGSGTLHAATRMGSVQVTIA